MSGSTRVLRSDHGNFTPDLSVSSVCSDSIRIFPGKRGTEATVIQTESVNTETAQVLRTVCISERSPALFWEPDGGAGKNFSQPG